MIRRRLFATRSQSPPLRDAVAVVHLRIVTPADRAAGVVELLLASPATSSLAHLPGASLHPPGDFVLADVAREETSVLVAQLRALGLEQDGSITIDSSGTVLGDGARDAERFAEVAPADAVLWEELESPTSTGAQLSFTYVGLMALATMIAAVGILTDSIVLIIGAMVVGPEFGPPAAASSRARTDPIGSARTTIGAIAGPALPLPTTTTSAPSRPSTASAQPIASASGVNSLAISTGSRADRVPPDRSATGCVARSIILGQSRLPSAATRSRGTFHIASSTMLLLILEPPSSRSVKRIGTSTTRRPARSTR